MNQLKVYSLQLPELFFFETGKKKIIVTLTFTPETRATRGDSYLGNRMEFHLFHSVNPQVLIEKYGVIENNADQVSVPDDLKQYEVDFSQVVILVRQDAIKRHGSYTKESQNTDQNPPFLWCCSMLING